MIRVLYSLRLYLLSTGRPRKLEGTFSKILVLFGTGLTLFEIWLGVIGTLDPYSFGTVFLTSMLALTFLAVRPVPNSKASARPPITDLALSLFSLAIGIYMMANMERYVTRIIGLEAITPLDMVVGAILVALTLEGTRRTLGPGLIFITVFFILYNLFGDHIPGYFSHRELSLQFFIDEMAFTNDGLMGVPIKAAATFVFLFVLFGALLAESGGGDFFYDLAASITGKASGGPAKIAVVSSGLFGMISGSPTSDVVTTGAITIPMMKRMGYRPEFAGAVETVASSGGSIMPPIMGSAAFLMVEYAGIPYLTVIKAAIIPAVLFYSGIFIQVHLHSRKIGLRGFAQQETPKLGNVLKSGYLYFLPLVLLVGLLFLGFTPSFSAVIVIFATIGISWIKKGKRLGVRSLYKVIETLIPRIAPLVMACAAAGLVIGGIMVTGLGGKFMSLIFVLAGGYVIPTLLITMVVCIILGMGMPVPSAYVLTAVLAVPALIKIGINELPAHFFIVYFAVVSAITPPVAVAAYAASSIAEADPIRIALNALKLGFPAFLVPFLFVLEPAILLEGNIFKALFAFVTGFIGISMVAISVEGFLRDNLLLYERLFFMMGGLILLYPSIYTHLIGISLLLSVLLMYQTRRRKKSSTSSTAL